MRTNSKGMIPSFPQKTKQTNFILLPSTLGILQYLILSLVVPIFINHIYHMTLIGS